ncbi:hypothetical protein IT398_01750 [Candidatus Nomurabacteria bacterium]|nr:hypothetical protein [Candidatus Nomurabacteria bacterium]
MDEQIKDFSKQLAWRPEIVNHDRLEKRTKFILCGMGGSTLAAGLLKVAEPKLDLLIHRDYGLPRVPDYFLHESVIILSSYSGNTVEVLDVGREALEFGLHLAVVTSGGKLLDWAKKNDLPYIVLPSGSQPRMALGYFCKALAMLLGDSRLLATLGTTTISSALLEAAGETLANKLRNKIPVIYSSTLNYPLAYHWKISFNETAKVSAFANAFPELNHNEMQSQFDPNQFSFIFLRDGSHDPRIEDRLDKLKVLYERAGLGVEVIQITGTTVWEKIFHSVILAEWTVLHLARVRQVDPETVPLIEEFKKSLV